MTHMTAFRVEKGVLSVCLLADTQSRCVIHDMEAKAAEQLDGPQLYKAVSAQHCALQ